MPISNYDGDTFVASVDIAGFKEMMKHDDRAFKALDCFYSSGYEVLRKHTQIQGVFISDCAVLFVNNTASSCEKLKTMMAAIEDLNRLVLKESIMLTASIAYGHFSYHQRLEFPGVVKTPIFGHAYIAAFMDTETSQPRIQPGECRIVKRGLGDCGAETLPRLVDEQGHIYFYWMVASPDKIKTFKSHYSDAYQQKYRGMLEAISDAANNQLDFAGDQPRETLQTPQ